MTAQVGRTVSKWTDFQIDDSGGTLRSIPVTSITGVGFTFEEMDVSAMQEQIKNYLPGQKEFAMTISGPFDNTTAQSAGTLSGSNTILSATVGGNTPLSLNIQIGMRHAWESGEPTFGITSSSTSGVLVTSYVADLAAMTYTATIKVMGATSPSFATTAFT